MCVCDPDLHLKRKKVENYTSRKASKQASRRKEKEQESQKQILDFEMACAKVVAPAFLRVFLIESNIAHVYYTLLGKIRL